MNTAEEKAAAGGRGLYTDLFCVITGPGQTRTRNWTARSGAKAEYQDIENRQKAGCKSPAFCFCCRHICRGHKCHWQVKMQFFVYKSVIWVHFVPFFEIILQEVALIGAIWQVTGKLKYQLGGDAIPRLRSE